MACGQNLDSKGVRGRWGRLQGMACCLRLFAFRTGLVADWVYCAPDGGNCRQGWGDFFCGVAGGVGVTGRGRLDGWRGLELRAGIGYGWMPGGFWVCIGFR